MDSSTFIAIITSLATLIGAASPIIVTWLQTNNEKQPPGKGVILVPEGVVAHHPRKQTWWSIILFALIFGISGYCVATIVNANYFTKVSLSALITPDVSNTSQTSKVISTITSSPINIAKSSVPVKIIITSMAGNRTSYDCSDSATLAALTVGEKIELELSTTMAEDDFGNLEWWVLISGSNKKFFVGKAASYTLTEGGVFYVKLDNATICMLKFQVSTP